MIIPNSSNVKGCTKYHLNSFYDAPFVLPIEQKAENIHVLNSQNGNINFTLICLLLAVKYNKLLVAF